MLDPSDPQASTLLVDALPEAISERVRPISAGSTCGEFVLVWMRTALRAHDNPALDAAIVVADTLGQSVFVYHALSERYPYASDRHHRFILEGARDVARQLKTRGLGTAFHLERPGHRGPHLRTLAARASLVITEDLPVPPLVGWTTALRAAVETPIWAVDTACVLPMRLVDRGFHRAYSFRDAYKVARTIRVKRPWVNQPVTRPPLVPEGLPFEPVDLEAAHLPELIAQCAIDHTVAPVADTRGGTAAGQARWAAFRDEGGLDRYASTRNAAQKDGTSRLSAYLHYGMISPFRVAAEASRRPGRGAEKFVEELLIWRELAHAWCSHQSARHSLDPLPEWALESLEAHAQDRRPLRPSWDTLARGRTGDRLWDACQHSLLRHGELHNNVRMTWGKQILQWTSGPEHARQTLVDLNHRYALDGRDPSSYGGLYWCLGLFDRPFRPAQPITGVIRTRDTAHHAGRIPLQRYISRVTRPVYGRTPSVAVIGAGIAGLSCARVLSDHGVPVTVFERSSQPGGRLAGAAVPGTSRRVDMGVQYVSARTASMQRWLDSLLHDGRAAVWQGRFARLEAGAAVLESPRRSRLVGLPDLGELARHLAEDLSLKLETDIAPPERVAGGWRLHDIAGAQSWHFDHVVVAVPAPSAAALLAAAPAMADVAQSVQMVPGLSVGMMFTGPLTTDFDALKVPDGPVPWLARDSSKPGRTPGEVWVAQTSHADDAPEAQERVVHEVRRLLKTTHAPALVWAKTWTAARALDPEPSGRTCIWDATQGIGVCGDWLAGRDLDAAWASGTALAGQILGELTETTAPADGPPSLFAPATR